MLPPQIREKATHVRGWGIFRKWLRNEKEMKGPLIFLKEMCAYAETPHICGEKTPDRGRKNNLGVSVVYPSKNNTSGLTYWSLTIL